MGAVREDRSGMTPEEWLKESNKVVADVIKLLHRYPELRILFPEIKKNREATLTNSMKIIGLENQVKVLQERLYSLMEDLEALKERVEDLEKEIKEIKEVPNNE